MNLTHRPVAFWSWNDQLEKDELLRQTEEFKNKGYGGFVIHARGGLVTEYLSEEWFSLVGTVIECAESLGLEVWIYDEFGWPSGFAGGKVVETDPSFAMPRLQIGDSCPPNCTVYAVYKKTESGYVRMSGAGTPDLYAYITRNEGYVNLLDADAVNTFIRITHEQYKKRFGRYFGGVIKGFFSDEPQINMDFPFSAEMEKEYNKLYGGDFKSELWRLTYSDGFDSFRYRFYKLAGEMFRKNFTQNIANWCEKNHLDFTGHFSNEDGLIASQANCGLMEHYALMQLPAIDFCGRRLMSTVPLKNVSSASRLFGKKYTMAEVFGCCGWNTSFADMQYLWGSLAVMGINKPCLHLSAYSMRGARKRDYPAFYSYQSESWNYMAEFAAWCERMNSVLSEGESVNDVLVLSPMNSVLSVKLRCAHARELSNSYRILIESLLENQVFFDVAEESVFQRGEVRGGCLNILTGSYRRVILSECDFVEEGTYLLLQKAAQNGIEIAFCEKIPQVLGRDGQLYPVGIEALVIYNRADLWRKYFDAVKYSRPVYARNRYSRPASGITVGCRRNADGLNVLLYNRDSDAKELHLIFEKEYVVSIACGLAASPQRLFAKEGLLQIVLPARGLVSLVCSTVESEEILSGSQVSAYFLRPFEARREEENVLTLDYISLSVDGENYGESFPVIRLKDMLLPQSEKLYIKYEWTTVVCPDSLSVAAETSGAEKICVNGECVQFGEDWFIDRSIRRTEISGLTRVGKNEIVFMYKNIGSEKEKYTFETQVNMHTEKAEYESIYLLGDFGVQAKSYARHNDYLAVDGGFCITGNEPINPEKGLTEQGLWFYKGGIRYSYSFDISEEEGKHCSVFAQARYYGFILALWINGEFCGEIASDADRVDLTPYVRTGKNELSVRLISSLRNCLGPHHHIMGEPNVVTPHSFTGKSCTLDRLICPVVPENTWTDQYNFVENCLQELKIVFMR